MRSPFVRLVAGAVAPAAALLLVSCGQDRAAESGHDGQHTTTRVPDAGASAEFDEHDVTFATQMIPHHEQALELAALVPDRSTDPALRALADRIAAAQEPEIRQLRELLARWGVDAGAGTHPGHGDHAHMPGMVDEATMARLREERGAAFEVLWLRSMIAHHEGAVAMAEAELADGTDPDARRLARQIIGAQRAEIDEMRAMLEDR